MQILPPEAPAAQTQKQTQVADALQHPAAVAQWVASSVPIAAIE